MAGAARTPLREVQAGQVSSACCLEQQPSQFASSSVTKNAHEICQAVLPLLHKARYALCDQCLLIWLPDEGMSWLDHNSRLMSETGDRLLDVSTSDWYIWSQNVHFR